MRELSPSANSQVRVRVPSKLNLFLAVRGRRPDGYHDLVTVFQTVSIHDTVVARLERTPVSAHPAARRFMELAFTVEAAVGLPTDDDNLAVRAARRLMGVLGVGTAEASHTEVPVTRLHLTKDIPVGAGMAGGSADAAAALVALNDLWEADLERGELLDLAAGLGADVPFCVTGGTALATGTGTALAQILTRGVYYWVVGISAQPLPTHEVYRAFDDVGQPSDCEPDAVLQALRTGDTEALGAALYNDLEAAALHLRPGLDEAKAAMLDAGAYGAVISGSGPTVAGLAASANEAVRIAAQVRKRFDRVEVAVSPAGGPEIVHD